MRLAVDVDNCTVEWQYHWADLYATWFGKRVDAEMLARWDGCIAGTHFENMTDFFAWFDRANGWRTRPWVPGAPGALDELMSLGVDITFCTACPKEAEEATEGLLMPWLGYPTTHIDFMNAASKHLTKADVWIDDSPEVLDNLIAHGKPCIRFQQPWNKRHKGASAFATDWAGVVDLIKETYL